MADDTEPGFFGSILDSLLISGGLAVDTAVNAGAMLTGGGGDANVAGAVSEAIDAYRVGRPYDAARASETAAGGLTYADAELRTGARAAIASATAWAGWVPWVVGGAGVLALAWLLRPYIGERITVATA